MRRPMGNQVADTSGSEDEGREKAAHRQHVPTTCPLLPDPLLGLFLMARFAV